MATGKTEIPLKSYREVKKLASDEEFAKQARELVKLTDEVKKKSDRISELRLVVYDSLVAALPEGERSVEFEKHRLTAYQGEAQERWDAEKIAKYLTVAQMKKCKTKGDPPRPTVSVNRLKTEKALVERAAAKLTHGVRK